MTERPNHLPPEGPGDTGPPLDYAARPAPGAASARIGQMIAGMVLAAAAFLGVAFVTAMAVGEIGMLVGPLVVGGLLVWSALRLRRNPRTRSWAAGIWIGLGIGLLVDGLCWAFMTSMEH